MGGASAADAQTNLTIYGIADAYTQVLDGATRLSRVQSGGISGSRLGFRGTETLDGSLKAIFTLETGINLDTGTAGQGGALFGRQSFAGLSGSWGQATLGRQLGSLYTMSIDFEPFIAAGPSTQVIGGFAGGYEPFRGSDATTSPQRINNAIRYATPSWNGLQAAATYGFGEVSGDTQGNRTYDLSVRYTAQPVDLYALYVSEKSASAASPTDVATIGLAVTYRIGSTRLYAGGVSVNDKRPQDRDGHGFWFGADYQWGANVVRAQWVANRPRSGGGATRTNGFGAGYQYNLSTRTSLYTSVTRFINGADAGLDGAGRINSALPVGLTRPGDANVWEYVGGLHHVF